MRVAINLYVGIMLLVFFAAGATITHRLHQLHPTAVEVQYMGKSERAKTLTADPWDCYPEGQVRYDAMKKGNECPGSSRR